LGPIAAAVPARPYNSGPPGVPIAAWRAPARDCRSPIAFRLARCAVAREPNAPLPPEVVSRDPSAKARRPLDRPGMLSPNRPCSRHEALGRRLAVPYPCRQKSGRSYFRLEPWPAIVLEERKTEMEELPPARGSRFG